MSLSEREKMLRGELYDAHVPDLTADRERAQSLCWQLNQCDPNDTGRREAILTDLLGSRGDHCTVMPGFRCDYGWNIHVGDHFYANYDLVVLDVCPVRIGRNCLIAPKVVISAAYHPMDRQTRCEDWLEYGAPVTIGDDVWIGAGVVINPGVTIGDNVVIGAGAVVTKDVASNCVIAGIPARFMRKLED